MTSPSRWPLLAPDPASQCLSLELVCGIEKLLSTFLESKALPDQGTSLLAIPEILLIFVDEPGVVLTPDQDYRSLGTKSPDLVIPHRPQYKSYNQHVYILFSLSDLQCSKLTILPVSKHMRTTSARP